MHACVYTCMAVHVLHGTGGTERQERVWFSGEQQQQDDCDYCDSTAGCLGGRPPSSAGLWLPHSMSMWAQAVACCGFRLCAGGHGYATPKKPNTHTALHGRTPPGPTVPQPPGCSTARASCVSVHSSPTHTAHPGCMRQPRQPCQRERHIVRPDKPCTRPTPLGLGPQTAHRTGALSV